MVRVNSLLSLEHSKIIQLRVFSIMREKGLIFKEGEKEIDLDDYKNGDLTFEKPED